VSLQDGKAGINPSEDPLCHDQYMGIAHFYRLASRGVAGSAAPLGAVENEGSSFIARKKEL
jgi:hypothetical protein